MPNSTYGGVFFEEGKEPPGYVRPVAAAPEPAPEAAVADPPKPSKAPGNG